MSLAFTLSFCMPNLNDFLSPMMISSDFALVMAV